MAKVQLTQRSAISKVNKNHALLVFPLNNKKEPRSIWSEFFPRTKMRWEWDESGDNRVGDMWFLMKKLSDCREVVYSKWFQGRATFFSRELFAAMLATKMAQNEPAKNNSVSKSATVSEDGDWTLFRTDGPKDLSPTARKLLDVLEMNSPLSTKELKRETSLQGKFNEGLYSRAMKELFQRLLIVGFGEVDDGAFPSLAVGATKLIYEDLWQEAKTMSLKEAEAKINLWMLPTSPFGKFWQRTNTR